MELPTGTIVDAAYRISAPLRLGKDGDIYLGEPIAPGPPVMIHILRCALMEGDPGLEVFERAGRELCKFSHDAFPEVVDFGRFMVRPYIVTENIDGRTLAKVIEAGELGSDHALRVINETRDALLAAHKGGMAHGALSPENVMIADGGEVKILDLFNRWMCHQINTKGGEIDTAADLHALVELSQAMMKGAKRVTKVDEAKVAQAAEAQVKVEAQIVAEAEVVAEAPANLTDDLDDIGGLNLPKKKFEPDTADLAEPPAMVLALAQEESDAPPVVEDEEEEEEEEAPRAMWEEFTPEPEVEMGGPPPTMVVQQVPELPPMLKEPAPIIVAPPPAPVAAPAGMKVRLPPPPSTTNIGQAKAMFPTPLPKIAATPVRMPPAVREPIQVKLPAPIMPMKTAPAPKPRVASFVPTSAALDFSDDPLVSPQLQPGYIEFFKRMFPRAGMPTSRVEGGEKASSRSFNLLLTCSVALLMLAAVLRF